MFLAGTSTELTDAAGAAEFLRGGACRFAFIEARQERNFSQRAEAIGLRYDAGPRIERDQCRHRQADHHRGLPVARLAMSFTAQTKPAVAGPDARVAAMGPRQCCGLVGVLAPVRRARRRRRLVGGGASRAYRQRGDR